MDGSAMTLPERVYALFADSQRVSLSDGNHAGDLNAAGGLAGKLDELLVRADELAMDVLRQAEAGGSGVEEARSAVDAVCAELRDHRQRLSSLRTAASAQTGKRGCGDALRALQRAMYTLEGILRHGGRPSAFLPTYLEAALQVRRYYRELWRFSTVTGDVDPGSVRSALRGAGTRIAVLAGCEVFSLLREDDRRYAEDLQQRILSWLRAPTNFAAGSALWRDFTAFAETLRSVNHREELIAHDRDVLVRASALLDDRGDEAIVEVSQVLTPVLGIDDALDEVISSHPSAKTLLRELRRTSTRFASARAVGSRGTSRTAAPAG